MTFLESVRRAVSAFRGSVTPGEPRIYVSTAQAGVRVTEDTALTFSAVWGAVRVIAETVAALPWHVYSHTRTGRVAMPAHQVHWLLNAQPNPDICAFALRETMMGHVLLWGNAYAEIERDRSSRPMALWPLEPDRVTPKRDEKTGALWYELRESDGRDRRIEPGNMLHLHGLGFDGVVGYSPIAMARRSMGIGIAQDAFAQSFFGNGTALGGVLQVTGKVSGEQIAAIESDWNSKRAGPGNAMKTKVLGDGMEYKQLSMPMTDAQFLESRRFSVLEVCRWFRVPPHKLAEMDRATWSNIEHQAIEFVSGTIVPWVTRWEQEINIKLFGARSQGRVYSKMAVNALLRGDAKARSEFYRSMVTMGAMSINEIRELEELNPIGPEGDAHLVQVNQTTLERLVEGELDNEPPDPVEPETEPDDDEMLTSARAWRAARATDQALVTASSQKPKRRSAKRKETT